MGVTPENKLEGDLRYSTTQGDTRGALFIAIDPTKFTDLDKFKAANTKLLKQIKILEKQKTPMRYSYQEKGL